MITEDEGVATTHDRRQMVRVMRNTCVGSTASRGMSYSSASRSWRRFWLIPHTPLSIQPHRISFVLAAARLSLTSATTKVHHATNCWYVDRYEEGRFPGGAQRKFMLVPAETVPDHVSGCQFCESGRPAAVKLRPARSLASGSASAPTQPVPGSIQLGSIVHVAEPATGESHHWHIAPRMKAIRVTGRFRWPRQSGGRSSDGFQAT